MFILLNIDLELKSALKIKYLFYRTLLYFVPRHLAVCIFMYIHVDAIINPWLVQKNSSTVAAGHAALEV